MRARRGVGAAAAIAGALVLAFKAVAIMLTGEQPPWSHETGWFLAAVALLGAHDRVRTRTDPLGRFAATGGLVAATVAAAGGATDLVLMALGSGPPDALAPVAPGGASLGLLLLGAAAISEGGPRLRWRGLPLSGAAAFLGSWLFVPLLLALGVSGHIAIEVPILVAGLVWVAVGYWSWAGAD